MSDAVFLFKGIPRAFAAQVQIDASVSTTQTEHMIAGAATVFISDQTGYKFYVDSTGRCVYAKTTNGGVSWGGASIVDTQTDCFSPIVWYDQWTPGDTGSYIHILTMDTNEDDLWYNRLDTSTDTLLLGTTPVNVTTGLGYLGSLSAGGNTAAITKGTDGTLYAGVSDATDSLIIECTNTCQTAGNWTETGTTPLDNQNDYILMQPQSGGNIMLIRRDLSLNDIQYQIWNNSSWLGPTSWSTIDSNAVENTTSDAAMSAVVDDDFNIYLVYADAANYTTANHDIRTAKYTGSWANTTNVTTDDAKGITGVAISLDENTGDVYVAFTGRTTINTANTANVYWATSTSAMSTWSSQQGPVNSAADDLYGVDLNHRNDERIYVSWYGITSDDMFGDTLADISPQTKVSATGSQVSTVRASSSAQHIGGAFVIQEFQASRFVNSIEITETGTIDGATGVGDIALYYDLSTTTPYDCSEHSFNGNEEQYGTTDTNGFSGADGVSNFTDAVTITPTQALCVYPVVEVVKAAPDATTLEVAIADPASDVVLSSGQAAVPSTAIELSGTTNIVDDVLTQTHFHFRNDIGGEGTSTSRTSGIQDTSLTALQQETPVRIRFGISNEGSTSTFPTTLRLDYATSSGSCSVDLNWIDVDATSDDWDMNDSTFINDGTNSTDISVGIGGVDNENSVFLSPNGGLRDTTSSIDSLTFLPTNWTEAEFSIIPTVSATEGQNYCFRLSDNGVPIESYDQYPEVTISADVRVRATSTQIATTDIPTTDFYIGGGFAIIENSNSRNVTSITLTENGTVDGSTGVSNVRLYYDHDTSAPYDCTGESYDGNELQFGATSTSGFSSANGTSTFTDVIGIATTSALCVYPVLDITASAQHSETIDIIIQSGSSDVVVSGGGSVAPATTLDITGSTTLAGAVMTQNHYHWRSDNGTEVTASSSVGTEDTPETEFPAESQIRLRFGLENTGPTTSVPSAFRLEYGVKLSTCENISVWTDVGATPDAWDMYDSPNLTHGMNTTDVTGAGFGEVSNPGGKTFLSSNGGVLTTDSESDDITLTNTEFVELEYSITSTATTSYATNYCFRVTDAGTPLPTYSQYAELSTAAKRDFRIQRGTSILNAVGTLTILPGPTTYTAPASTSLAFVRITNMHHTGGGRTIADNTVEPHRATVYISDSSDLTSGFTLARNNSTQEAVVSWEIIEFIGELSTDNEMRVRDVGTVTLTGANTTATGTAVSGISDDSDVVVFITGLGNANTSANGYYNSQVTSRWNSDTNEPVFERIGAGSNAQVSYAVVEFTGVNWQVQRIEHEYQEANSAEIELIDVVTSISQTFLHTQKRMGALTQQANFGHEVWISSIGAISFKLSPNAATSSGQVSVAWVIENTQTSEGKMKVQQKAGSVTGGTEPRTASISITEVDAMNNTSVFAMSAFEQNTTNYPRVLGGVTLASTTAFEIYNSDIVTSIPFFYRTEIVEWPTTGLSIRQNYYRWYANNDALDPTDPWPLGAADVGENTVITALDEPIAEGEIIRLRVTLEVRNADLPAGLRTHKLQYGARTSTCTAIEDWTDVGAIGSGEIWRGYDTSVADGIAVSEYPALAGELNIDSVSEVGGRFVEQNPSLANPYDVQEDQDFEYDFVIEHNGANGSTFYCFRVVNSNGETLDGYNNYPQLRTAGFTPVLNHWRWFGDPENETPSAALAGENVAPIEIAFASSTSLRVNVSEIKGVEGNNTKFKLQYSQFPDFSDVHDVQASSSCTASSTWCYAEGGGVNNALISTTTLTTSDSCISSVGVGCGTHNEDGIFVAGDTHSANATREYEFVIQHAGARANGVYYFRLFDLNAGAAVAASSTYPSLVTEGATLVFGVQGVGAAITTEGITTDVLTTPTEINFGSLLPDTVIEAAQRLNVNTNATQGYQVLLATDGDMVNSYNNPIPNIVSTNASPSGWNTACQVDSSGCIGYHTGDDILANGSTRFAPDDSYAGFDTVPAEIIHSSIPIANDSVDIVYKIEVTSLQESGEYELGITYFVIPIF
ncbi:hypothetical protein KC906_00025 [Candidatus Kaiserbacteria bacterium]|nr:hypothetical protein [Candidatus Kaiserbacteria bacterium]